MFTLYAPVPITPIPTVSTSKRTTVTSVEIAWLEIEFRWKLRADPCKKIPIFELEAQIAAYGSTGNADDARRCGRRSRLAGQPRKDAVRGEQDSQTRHQNAEATQIAFASGGRFVTTVRSVVQR